jgi:hypothetical protein
MALTTGLPGYEVIGAYHRAVAQVVARFDGFVAKYMGDGVLIYFGYPQAHEDDAERAVRAGLGFIDAVGRLDVKSVTRQARVGIATGLVVVGDLIGEGSAQEQSVVGETPNWRQAASPRPPRSSSRHQTPPPPSVSTGAKPNRSALHSVCIRTSPGPEINRFANSIFSDPGPRCTYPL